MIKIKTLWTNLIYGSWRAQIHHWYKAKFLEQLVTIKKYDSGGTNW